MGYFCTLHTPQLQSHSATHMHKILHKVRSAQKFSDCIPYTTLYKHSVLGLITKKKHHFERQIASLTSKNM